MNGELTAGFGRKLAEAREAKGLTVAQVAEQLKLSGRQIEAIEAEDYSRLPAPVFVRGFIRNYARLVELPIETLPAVAEAPAAPTETITAHSEELYFRASPVRRWLVLPIAVFGVFLIMVAILYSWLSRGEESYVPNEPVLASEPLPLPAQPVTPAVEAPVPPATVAAAPETAPVAAVVPPVPATPDTAVPPSAVTPAPAPIPAPAPVPAAAPAPATEAGQAGRVVQLVAEQADAWVEVVAGNNKRYSRLLKVGEQLTLRGTPPFQLVVGNAAGVRLSYDGRAIDLTPHTGKTVARLTLE
jgi:cytoskeleton protein RodZ